MDPVQRFIKYAKIDTQADDTTGTTPSTEKQKDLSRVLVEDLKELGLEDAYMDEYGIVYAHLKGEGDKIGLNAHVDTALEVTDTNCNPQIIKNYDGKDYHLNDKYVLSSEEFPALKKHIGKDLVVTDGNTLLGADDKAGIAIIMGVLEHLHNHPEIKHHNISVCFTVDEEIGEGPKHFDLKKMDADYAFTIDGGDISHIDAENFNAQQVHIHVEGVSVHPGEGKNALINALLVLHELIETFPKKETPYDANEDEGYWHINGIEGSSDVCDLDMILRDFDYDNLLKRSEYIKEQAALLLKKYPKAKIDVAVRDQYYNMLPYVQKDPRPVDKAKEALIKNGLTPVMSKIRGGTDGATFSKRGLVTPNLGTGSSNHHGRYEYLVVQDFLKMIDVVLDIVKL
ncbi:MAG: peptidase T [Bacilli bacterium]|nr:peptidase T [Bacilli bacterium]